MAIMANVTLADGQATPVNHIFGPQGTKDGIATYYDRSGGIAIGYPRVTFKLDEATASRPNNKLTLRVVRPVLEVTAPSTATGIQPAPTLAYNLVADVTFVLPQRSTLAERNDILAYAKNLLANGIVTSAVQNYEQVW
jgi:hypothetical protein